MKNKIEDLRNHLFAALEGLADPEKPLDIERAKAIADVGRVIVDSAKVEVAFLAATQRTGTGFIPQGEAPSMQPRLAVSSARG
jgi:hypothetical protein